MISDAVFFFVDNCKILDEKKVKYNNLIITNG